MRPRQERGAKAGTDRFSEFQANVLSLVSHELRTPLMGVLNGVTLLEDLLDSKALQWESDAARAAFEMLSRNARVLEKNLKTNLDLAKIETGHFRPRLREVELAYVLRPALGVLEKKFRLRAQWQSEKLGARTLADPSLLVRAIEIVYEILQAVGATGAESVQALLGSHSWEWSISLNPEGKKAWQQMEHHASDVHRMKEASRTAQVLQSESQFLARSQEGFGTELVLLREIFEAHGGTLEWSEGPGLKSPSLVLRMSLPERVGEDRLKAVLISRVFEASTGLKNVALAWIAVPAGLDPGVFSERLRNSLFRASDGVFEVPQRGAVALVLDDCKREDAPKLLIRLEKTLGLRLQAGIAMCPEDGSDPDDLIRQGLARLADSTIL